MSWYDLSLNWPLRPPIAAAPGKKSKGKAKAVDDDLSSSSLRPDERNDLEKTLNMARHRPYLVLCVCTVPRKLIRRTVGYSVVAYNLVLPPNTFDPTTVKLFNPCKEGRPSFPEVDPRFSKRRDREGVLQLSRMTVTFDETCITGQGNGRCFVRALSLRYTMNGIMTSHRSARTQICWPNSTSSRCNRSTQPPSPTPVLISPPLRQPASISSPSTSLLLLGCPSCSNEQRSSKP